MDRRPQESRAENNTEFTRYLQRFMQENAAYKSTFGVSDVSQSAYFSPDKCILHLPPLPRSVDKELGFNTTNETLHIKTADLSKVLHSNNGVKRSLEADDCTFTSGYESDDEDLSNIHVEKSARKKQRTQQNEVIHKKRQQVEDRRQKWYRMKKDHCTNNNTCVYDSKFSFVNGSSSCSSSGSEESISSNSSDAYPSYSSSDTSDAYSSYSSSDTSDAYSSKSSSDSSDVWSSDLSGTSSSDSSDDNSMDTNSESYISSLGLSLSDTSSSSDTDDNLSTASSFKSLKPKIIPCPKSCVCMIGNSAPPSPIARRAGVSVPLYKRLLTRRLLHAANVSKYDCCDHSCYTYWLHSFRSNT